MRIVWVWPEGQESFSDGNVGVFHHATLRKRLPTLSFSDAANMGQSNQDKCL